MQQSLNNIIYYTLIFPVFCSYLCDIPYQTIFFIFALVGGLCVCVFLCLLQTLIYLIMTPLAKSVTLPLFSLACLKVVFLHKLTPGPSRVYFACFRAPECSHNIFPSGSEICLGQSWNLPFFWDEKQKLNFNYQKYQRVFENTVLHVSETFLFF